MASYPTSAKTFTAKSAGQTIASAHVNDLQDEVNAIETGLLTGTARLNSSHSTVAAFSVTGGSTFAIRPVAPPPDLARVFVESAVVFDSSQVSTALFAAQTILTNSSMHSTATPDRIVPQSTGVYYALLQLAFSSTEAGFRSGLILDSSGVSFAEVRQVASSRGNVIQVGGYKRFDVLGGHVTAQIEAVGQSTCRVSTGAQNSWFSLQKL